MNTTHVAAVMLVAAALGLGACATPQASEAPVARAVRVAEAHPPELPRGLRYAVTIQPADSLTLALKASGYVAAMHQVRAGDGHSRTLQPGDVVQAGTVLVRVREAEYRERLNQTRGALAEAEASQVKARLDLERARALFAADSLTQPDLDAAQAAFDAATARVQSAAAQVEGARLALADCVLTSPMDAVVLERRIEVGMLGGAGSVAFVLGRVSDVEAVLGVPDSVVSQLALGVPLSMTTEAFPGVSFVGRITAIAPSADPQSRVFAVEVTLPNRDGRLRPGMIGAVELIPPAAAAPSGDALVVPLAALVRATGSADAYGVFVVEHTPAGEVARARHVALGAAAGNDVIVTHGLRRGDRVIAIGGSLVRDGDPVRIIP